MASMKPLLEAGEPMTVTGPVKPMPTSAFSSVPYKDLGLAFGEHFPAGRRRPGPGQRSGDREHL